MDATGDQDLKVQKSSPELIAELRNSLAQFLWKSKNDGSVPGAGKVRRLVRRSKTDQLIKLLEPFQEWPQLLDPHLSDLLQPLVSAFIEYLSNHATEYHKSGKCSSRDVIPLPIAICKILYIFCKVRGQKVIIRFMNNEPRYLEPMLDALESWAQPEASVHGSSPDHKPMIWEERFVVLWWLSHLMLAPFHLVSMSSESPGRSLGSSSLQINLPDDTLPIAKRLVNVSTFYLGFASKEREAAALLLARIALKPDLQSSGLQKVIIEKVISSLNEGQGASMSIHTLIGVLSFLAKFILSADSRALQPLLEPLYSSIKYITSRESRFYDEITSSSLARKLVIKISRAVAVTGTKAEFRRAQSYIVQDLQKEQLEDILQYLFAALQSKDTSVRIATSKALSVTTAHLDDEMAQSVCDYAIEELSTDLSHWDDVQTGQVISRSDFDKQGVDSAWSLPSSFRPNFRTVNASKWHGLILTLSQLIYNGVVKENLPNVLDTVAAALNFQQSSSLRVSVGANVRDAACYGLWALARRYSTSDILQLPYGRATLENSTRIQSLANDLVVTATLDPNGNIRRGASAALQEMVGRHPDQVRQGIKLVQVVDYHAIALRSKAMLGVAVDTSEIDPTYWHVILNGLLSLRGVGSLDGQSRRQAADAVGRLTLHSGAEVPMAFETVRDQLLRTTHEEVELRHGLILALAQIVQAMLEMKTQGAHVEEIPTHYLPNDEPAALWHIFYSDDATPTSPRGDVTLDGKKFIVSSPSPDLRLEAICRLISILASSVVFESSNPQFAKSSKPSAADLHMCIEVINMSLRRTDPIVINAASEAAASIFRILDPTVRVGLVRSWVAIIDNGASRRKADQLGVIAALGAVFQHVGDCEIGSSPESKVAGSGITGHQGVQQWLGSVHRDSQPASPMQILIINALLTRLCLEHSKDSTEHRCAILGSLTSGVLQCRVVTADILDTIYTSLSDYTINEKGDVGSLVRVEAINAVAMLLAKDLLNESAKQKFVGRICGLATEKLDKIRWRAWNCLQPYLPVFGLADKLLNTICDIGQTSSIVYFNMLLELGSHPWIRKPLLEGYITSAGGGSESLVQATRAAFAGYTRRFEREPWTTDAVTFSVTVMDIFQENLTNDRLLLPTLQFLIYLLNTQILRPLQSDKDLWSTFFHNLQRSHYKSANIPKIEAAVKIYAALVPYPPLRKATLKKLCQMLSHPYARIRNAAAESLFIITEDRGMVGVDWGMRPVELRADVDELRVRLGVAGK